ncbi:toxin VasX [Kangiella spongicola]|uniref:Toxin VasX N-terminal region domain-containing protein n=1 Tax=Kangiella spongicola TaxID=796379 RepID=A0A318D901_9GAMM|nr:toxin VasX [Kangiella spongicola]PXF64198.1 hypothetical protein DL796_03415 [Kangiella spongicola]
MPRENLSATQNANDPVAPCDRNIIPIFPVRFAFKPEVLMEIANNYRNTSAEDDMHNEKDYCLRRIRQGFVYIFVPNCVEDKDSCSDHKKGYWLVFRYYTSSEDQNSNEIRSDTETLGSGQYTFQMYNWVDGHAAGKWELDSSRIYPYAFVPNTTTQIEIGYSEFRWPSYFFEEAERNPSFRENILTPVDLSAEQTNFSAPMRDLDKHVEEFKPNLLDKISDYLISQTGIAPEDKKTVAFCERSKTIGRIIALHDPMGRILDISNLAKSVNNTQLKFASDYQYPLTIAQCVANVKDSIDESWNTIKGWFSNDPIESDTWQNFLDANDKITSMKENLIKIHKGTFSHQLNYSMIHQLQALAENGFGRSEEEDIKNITFLTNIMTQFALDLSTSKEGSDYILDTLNGEANTQVTSIYNLLLSKWNAVISTVHKGITSGMDHALSAMEAFDYLLQESATAFSRSMVQYNNTLIQNTTLGVYGFKTLNHQPLSLEDVVSTFDGETPTINKKTGSVSTNRIVVIAGSTRLASPQLNAQQVYTLHVQTDAEITPAAGFQNKAYAQEKFRIGGAGLALFLNSVTIADLYHQKNNPSKSKTQFGRIADNFWANITIAYTSAVTDTYQAGRAISQGGYASSSGRALGQKLFDKLSKNALFKTQSAVLPKFSQKAIAVADFGSKWLGRLAGGAGVFLSLLQTADGIKSRNYSKAWGNSLIALGSALFLYTGLTGWGAVVAVVLILAGIAIEYFGGLNDIEDWAKHSFWGSSHDYWGTRRLNIRERLLLGQAISRPDHKDFKTIKSYFDEEIKSYTKLFDKFAVLKPESTQPTFFQLKLPNLDPTKGKAILKVDIEIEYWLESSYIFDNNITLSRFNYELNYQDKTAMIDFGDFLPQGPGYIKEIIINATYKQPWQLLMEVDDYVLYEYKAPTTIIRDKFDIQRGLPSTVVHMPQWRI